MKVNFPVYILLCISLSLSNGQSDDCDTEGDEIRSGQTWYVCTNGQLRVSACSVFDTRTKVEKRVEVGASYWTRQYVMKCEQSGPNIASVRPVGCIRNGQVMAIGKIITDDKFWYLCKKDEKSGLLLQASGCVDSQSNQLVQPDGVLIRGAAVFTCIRNDTDSAVWLEPRGCYTGGQLYNLGDEVVANGFWYLCNVSSAKNTSSTDIDANAIELKRMGCFEDGKKLKHGDSFTVGNFVFKCDMKNPSNALSRTGVGCNVRTPNGTYEQKPIGDRWLEGNPPIRIVMECKPKGIGVSKGPVQCYYESDDKKYQTHMEPNCAELFPNGVMVTCSIKNGRDVNAQIVYSASQKEVDKAVAQGFKVC